MRRDIQYGACLRRFGLGLLVMLAGCPWAAPVPRARVYHGPAYGPPLTTVVALPVECDALREVCTPEHATAIAAATRMELEFVGYTVVDSELINAEMRRRTTETHEQLTGPSVGRVEVQPQTFRPPSSGTSSTTAVSGGTTWFAASPEQQQALLAALGASGVLRTTISLGEAHGMAQQRTVDVAVTLTRLDGQIAWRADCSVETGDYHSAEQAMELATHCALESVALW